MQLDTLCVPASLAEQIRERVAAETGFPAANVMVTATHNHAGPAIASVGDSRRDDEYVALLVEKATAALASALKNLQPAELGFARRFQFGIGHNRRVVMRDGTVRTHGSFADPNALCFEGPVDPEVAVLGVRSVGGTAHSPRGAVHSAAGAAGSPRGTGEPPRGTAGSPSGRLLGAVVNFTCHPAHHGGDESLSGGYPAQLAQAMRAAGCPVTVFLQGAAGNIATADPTRTSAEKTMEEIGSLLAAHVRAALEQMSFSAAVEVGCVSRTIQLPFRKITDAEVAGTVRGAQRFVDPAIYDREIPAIVESIRRQGTEPAEVQALFFGDVVIVGVPAEYFVEYGLQIKESAWPRAAMVVSHANGIVGYVPTRAAFARGGYETTFGPPSRLAPEAGDILAEAAIELITKGAR